MTKVNDDQQIAANQKTPATSRTASIVIAQMAAGMFVGLIVAVGINVFDNYVYALHFSREAIAFCSIGFGLYSGFLYGLVGNKFWRFLGSFLKSQSL